MIIIAPPKKSFNEYKINNNGSCEFYIERKENKFTILVDREDLDRLIEFNRHWVLFWNGWSYYVMSSEYLYSKNCKIKRKLHYLHRFIMNAEKGDIVDHINCGETLDNRKVNLRITHQPQNMQNRRGANKNNKTTGIRNVNYVKRANAYWVQFTKDGKRFKWSFSADKFKEACAFAEDKRKELYGEFAGDGGECKIKEQVGKNTIGLN